MSAPQQSFRSQLSSFRWANSVQDDSAPAAPTSSNPFSRAYSSISNSVSDYVPLRSTARSDEEEAYFALSRWERFLGFLACLAGGVVCFFVAFLTLPLLAFKPRKFVMAFSLGSLLFMAGFSVLQGPTNHLKHIMSKERLPFSVAYFGSLGLTLYFALGLKSTIGTLIAAIAQVPILPLSHACIPH
ncbi:hypothetical protein QFC20_001400 [Naganishia adeliensis]|uniref:Uncharacterized protein n=1 Tax=Naganishia adeliensis TaxID=92952 RepID=A0ACC2WVG6_9TREE|nr:hypothetical protein QFC20_001400 [Naganishia adeliensis]